MADFAADTAVEGRDGRYRAQLSRDWEVWGPNGGYLAAIALRAAGAATSFRRPASFACHFLAVANFGEVTLDVVPLRAGRRAASLRVSMLQMGRRVLEAITWITADGEGLAHDVARMPDVPLPATLRPIEELTGEPRPYRFWENLEYRPTRFVPLRERRPDVPAVCDWYRFRPHATFADPFLDAARALVLVDTMLWPAAWRAHAPDPPYQAPSLDVAVRFHRAAPDSEWLLCDAVAPVAADGLIGGQASIWAVDGRLLASGGGQLLCRPVPASS